VGPEVGPNVGPLVGPEVGPTVGPALVGPLVGPKVVRKWTSDCPLLVWHGRPNRHSGDFQFEPLSAMVFQHWQGRSGRGFYHHS
jgi:hypothetical protein